MSCNAFVACLQLLCCILASLLPMNILLLHILQCFRSFFAISWLHLHVVFAAYSNFVAACFALLLLLLGNFLAASFVLPCLSYFVAVCFTILLLLLCNFLAAPLLRLYNVKCFVLFLLILCTCNFLGCIFWYFFAAYSYFVAVCVA